MSIFTTAFLALREDPTRVRVVAHAMGCTAAQNQWFTLDFQMRGNAVTGTPGVRSVVRTLITRADAQRIIDETTGTGARVHDYLVARPNPALIRSAELQANAAAWGAGMISDHDLQSYARDWRDRNRPRANYQLREAT